MNICVFQGQRNENQREGYVRSSIPFVMTKDNTALDTGCAAVLVIRFAKGKGANRMTMLAQTAPKTKTACPAPPTKGIESHGSFFIYFALGPFQKNN